MADSHIYPYTIRQLVNSEWWEVVQMSVHLSKGYTYDDRDSFIRDVEHYTVESAKPKALGNKYTRYWKDDGCMHYFTSPETFSWDLKDEPHIFKDLPKVWVEKLIPRKFIEYMNLKSSLNIIRKEPEQIPIEIQADGAFVIAPNTGSLIAYIDFGAVFFAADGKFTIQFPPDGIFNVSLDVFRADWQ